MQFGAAITEYVLPGLPVTAALAYSLARVARVDIKQLVLPTEGYAVAGMAAVVFLGVSYMLGVVVHWLARNAFRAYCEGAEESAWHTFGPYSDGALDALGPTVRREVADRSPGWILLRMRYFLIHHSPECAAEIRSLHAIARAARGAFGLPIALATWLLADFWPPIELNWELTLARAALAVALWVVVGKTYRYRWGVVSRATIAGFLSRR